jgi:heptaprenyl diphosphate synthase
MISISKDKYTEKLNIDSALEATTQLISTTLKKSPIAISHITNHLSLSSGKGIRTKLLLICAMDEFGLIPQSAIEAAASLEIIHLATLVHDDIIDDSPLRRGIESIQSKFGKRQAVICGDYLFCLAFSTISKIYQPYTHLIPMYANAISKVCLGELNQFSNNNNTDISLFQYLKVISGKTASLFYIAAHSGSVLGGLDEKQSKHIAKFGSYLGMIFQILDDCKDYRFTQFEAEKPIENDLTSGVITLPLIMSFLKEPLLRNSAKQILRTGVGIDVLIKEVHRLDGVESSISLAEKYANKSKKILNNINANTLKHDHLYCLLNNTLDSVVKY